jgi:hypothetical protein
VSETPIPPGMPGHSGGTASARRMPVRIDDDGMIRQGFTDLWEVICPACGDRRDLDYDNAPPEIRSIRGPYGDQVAARVALMVHIGLENDETRAARELSQ